MSKERNDDDPVTEKLCVSRRQTVDEKIEGLKTTIYAVGATIVIIVSIVEVILKFV